MRIILAFRESRGEVKEVINAAPTAGSLGGLKTGEMNMSELTKVLANQETIIANQQRLLENQSTIKKNQRKLDRVLANQALIIANQKRILAGRRQWSAVEGG
jgi:hypothetical protein